MITVKYKCKLCGNKNEDDFLLSSDDICTYCYYDKDAHLRNLTRRYKK